MIIHDDGWIAQDDGNDAAGMLPVGRRARPCNGFEEELVPVALARGCRFRPAV